MEEFFIDPDIKLAETLPPRFYRSQEVSGESSSISVYPNPVRGELSFQWEGENVGLAVVRDVSGRFVWSGKIESGRNRIETGGWSKGVYTLEAMSTEGERFVGKFIVE